MKYNFTSTLFQGPLSKFLIALKAYSIWQDHEKLQIKNEIGHNIGAHLSSSSIRDCDMWCGFLKHTNTDWLEKGLNYF